MATDPTLTVRMEPIATLPVFFKLGGKRAVIAGGTSPAVWKAELLSAAGAAVEVFSADPCPDMRELARHPPAGSIRLIARAWEPSDLDGAAIAIGDIEENEAETFRQAARRAGVPVNVIDKPAFCDFQFATIVSRSPLVVGISTDGAAPVFGQAIRARIEALLPQGLTRWARAARDWRPDVQALDLDFRRRRRFWEVFAERAFASPHDAPDQADFASCRAAIDTPATPKVAELALVGAGPGDPDAVTLRAIRALQAADVVIHAADLSPTIVGFARREALKVAVLTSMPPGDLDALVTDSLAGGRHVVWLDRGNPDLCLRWTARAHAATDRQTTVIRIAGLGLCPSCTPDCPAWPRA